MKSKQSRQHYAKKQLKRRDPRRVCRAFSWIAIHVPTGVATISAESTETLTFISTCENCHEKIETQLSVADWTSNYWESISSSIWRTWQYVIQEEPW